ncbi:hypothetical protein M3J09_006558 [Ascochyta lentis]
MARRNPPKPPTSSPHALPAPKHPRQATPASSHTRRIANTSLLPFQLTLQHATHDCLEPCERPVQLSCLHPPACTLSACTLLPAPSCLHPPACTLMPAPFLPAPFLPAPFLPATPRFPSRTLPNKCRIG